MSEVKRWRARDPDGDTSASVAAVISAMRRSEQIRLLPGSSPLMIVADPSGQQVAALAGSVHDEELARELWLPLGRLRLAEARKLANEADYTNSLRLLLTMLDGEAPDEIRRPAGALHEEVQFEMAKSWAEKGRHVNALRLLNRFRTSNNSELRQQAEALIQALRKEIE